MGGWIAEPRFLLLLIAHPALSGNRSNKQDVILSQVGAEKPAKHPETSLCVRSIEEAGRWEVAPSQETSVS